MKWDNKEPQPGRVNVIALTLILLLSIFLVVGGLELILRLIKKFIF